jgi:hypothetical protein
MSNFYQVYYDIQNAPFEEVSYISSPSEDEKETTIKMNHNNNPYLTPKFSYVNQDSFLLKNNYVNDENNQNEHNKRRKRCRIIFDSPFQEKSKPQDLFNKSLNADKKEKKVENTYSNSDDDNLSIHTVLSCFSFRPDLIEPSFFNKPTPNKTTLQKSTSHEDLEYSDISDDGF